jgi:hypothetical protein
MPIARTPGTHRAIAATLAITAIGVVGPGSTAIAAAADGGGGGTPWWPGVVTGIGAAAALAFALWPAWRRSRPEQAGDPTTEPALEAAAAPPMPADLRALVVESRARLERIATEAGQHEAQVIEQISARQLQALRDAATNANTQLERLVGEWQTRLEAAAAGGGTVGATAAVSAPPGTAQAMQTAVEAFQRLRRIQQQAIAELEEARADAVTSIDSARADLERTATERSLALDAAASELLAQLDQTGTRWLGRIEKAARQNGSGTAPAATSRRRRASPPVVGVIVACAIAVGAVAFAVAGDNAPSDAGPRLRASGVPETTTTVPATTTLPPETAPATTTPPSTAPPATAPRAPAPPAPTAPITQPPVVTLAPPALPNLPPVTFPRNPAIPDNICRLAPAVC